MLKQIFVVVAVFWIADAQKLCAAPSYFQAQAIILDHENNFYRNGFFSYDAIGERTRFFERVEENAPRPQFDVLDLYKERKRYTVDMRTRECNVTHINHSFRKIKVPENSTFVGTNTLGLVGEPGAGVLVSAWSYRMDDDEVRGNGTMSFTSFECVPNINIFHGEMKSNKKPIRYFRTFYDVQFGLNDPNIFDIPRECTKKRN